MCCGLVVQRVVLLRPATTNGAAHHDAEVLGIYRNTHESTDAPSALH